MKTRRELTIVITALVLTDMKRTNQSAKSMLKLIKEEEGEKKTSRKGRKAKGKLQVDVFASAWHARRTTMHGAHVFLSISLMSLSNSKVVTQVRVHHHLKLTALFANMMHPLCFAASSYHLLSAALLNWDLRSLELMKLGSCERVNVSRIRNFRLNSVVAQHVIRGEEFIERRRSKRSRPERCMYMFFYSLHGSAFLLS